MAELLLGDAVETEHCRCWLLDAAPEQKMEWNENQNDGKMKNRDLEDGMKNG